VPRNNSRQKSIGDRQESLKQITLSGFALSGFAVSGFAVSGFAGGLSWVINFALRSYAVKRTESAIKALL
jgi:hypothetical protein